VEDAARVTFLLYKKKHSFSLINAFKFA
jgi:hypothetical protein